MHTRIRWAPRKELPLSGGYPNQAHPEKGDLRTTGQPPPGKNCTAGIPQPGTLGGGTLKRQVNPAHGKITNRKQALDDLFELQAWGESGTRMPLKAWLLKAIGRCDCASAATHLKRRVGHAHTPRCDCASAATHLKRRVGHAHTPPRCCWVGGREQQQ